MRLSALCVVALFALACLVPEPADACGNGGGGLFARMKERRMARSSGNMMTATYSQSMTMRGPAMMVVPMQQAPAVMPRGVRGGCQNGQCIDAELQQQPEQQPQPHQLEFISVQQAPPVKHCDCSGSALLCECTDGHCQCGKCALRLCATSPSKQAPPVLYP